MKAQLRRAAVSIASNIAERKGRFSDKELLCFLSNARKSVYETQTQIVLAEQLSFLNVDQARNLSNEAAEIRRLLTGLIRVLREPIGSLSFDTDLRERQHCSSRRGPSQRHGRTEFGEDEHVLDLRG